MENPAMPDSIPRILHQTWKTRNLPDRFAALRASWRRFHPDWELRLYDDADCRGFVAREFPDLLTLYEGLPKPIQRADFFRYLVVFRCGGLYADVDMECCRNHDALLAGTDLVLGVEETWSPIEVRRGRYPHRMRIANCIFAARPGHEFLQLAIGGIHRGVAAVAPDEVIDFTGPGLLTHLVHAYGARFPFRLLPQICWMPPTLPAYPNVFPFTRHIYAKHHFAGTWKPGGKHKLALPGLIRSEVHDAWQDLRAARHPGEILAHLRAKLPPAFLWREDLAFWKRPAEPFKSIREQAGFAAPARPPDASAPRSDLRPDSKTSAS
jgi:hypothetical protein